MSLQSGSGTFSSSPKRNAMPSRASLPAPTRTTTNLLSASVDLFMLEILYKWQELENKPCLQACVVTDYLRPKNRIYGTGRQEC